MFLYQLNLPEKMAFLRLAKHIVYIDDNQMDEDEFSILLLMCNEMQISINDVYSIDFSLEKLAKQFKDRVSQKICMVELIVLAYANHEYHPSQNELIISLQNIFNFEVNEIEKMEEWVAKLSKVYREGIDILEEYEV